VRVRVLLAPDPHPVSSDATAVVIDVLRATTTLTVALASGARTVHAIETPEAARARAAHEPGALLCGERGGRILPGFDLGNSPFEYTPERVGGRTLLFASTNGSVAMARAKSARRTWLGAFVNAAAVLDRLGDGGDVVLVCAGKLGRFALEDAACAGYLANGLVARGARLEGAPARAAAGFAPRDAGEVRAAVVGCSHARELSALGPEFVRDVAFCAELDRLDRAFAV
jgi:2-phosphosulfolactate phosphatase